MASAANCHRLASFSQDGIYRYSLERNWPFVIGHRCVFVMLNPSTADDRKDDPTVRRCINYAARWGCNGLTVVNLFAYRATYPRELLQAADCVDIVGPENDEFIARAFEDQPLTVFAWGRNADGWDDRIDHIRYLARIAGIQPQALGFTKSGQPVHPLRQRADAWLVPA